MNMPFLNLAAIRYCTESEGPGKRFALWVQGCERHCPGCCNQSMQKIKKNKIVSTDDVIRLIAEAKNTYEIEGITMIGGEPMLQAEGLSHIAEWCHSQRLSVLVFTGYLYQELLQLNNPHIVHLLKFTDILVDGPFVEDQYDTKRDWIGSLNQKVYYLSDYYENGIEYQHNIHSMEIRITDSSFSVNGWPFL